MTNDPTHVIATTAIDDGSLPADKDPDWPHSWWSIRPSSALPANTHAVIIDGFSQTGASPNTLTTGNNAVLRVELSGETAGAAVGLSISAGGSTVRGLAVNRFLASYGIALTSGNCAATGNFIGTDVSGTLDLGNGSGILASSFGAIGGSLPAAVNLISGNEGNGIEIFNTSNLVLGNSVGTKANETSALGNSGNGILFSTGGSGFNTVGGTAPEDGNTIAFNGGDGVQVDGTAGNGNAIRGNSISSNGTTATHLGIDLGADGVTANDTA